MASPDASLLGVTRSSGGLVASAFFMMRMVCTTPPVSSLTVGYSGAMRMYEAS